VFCVFTRSLFTVTVSLYFGKRIHQPFTYQAHRL